MSEIESICKFIDNLSISEEKTVIVPSKDQTKQWRKNQSWYKNGKLNECEIYQIKNIEKLTKTTLKKTNDRIYFPKIIIKNISHPMKEDDGFEYSENFDGLIKISNIDIKKEVKIYFNLKFVCDKGGAQTRSLREVYHFIKYQLKFLLINLEKNTYFINILDGDECYRNMSKFKHLISKNKYKTIISNLYCGNTYDFIDWYNLYLN